MPAKTRIATPPPAPSTPSTPPHAPSTPSAPSASAGKGKKHCPSCDGLIAARSSTCPLCSYVIPPKAAKAAKVEIDAAVRKAATPLVNEVKIDANALIKVLAARGFKFMRLRNELTGEIVREESDPKIDGLHLKYAPIPTNAPNGIYVIQTSNQIQFAMNLDTFLEIAKLKP